MPSRRSDTSATSRMCSGRISYPRFRQNVFWLGGVIFDFLAQHAHVSPQVLQLAAVLRAPDGPQELDVCQNGVRVLHHECQEVELLWRKVNLFLTSPT